MDKVLKFGGTSVGSAVNMKKVANIVIEEGAQITVLSAMSGTTDTLIKIVSMAKAGSEATEIEGLISTLKDKYCNCIEELLVKNKQQAIDKMSSVFDILRHEACNFRQYESDRVIISQGELLTTAIFTLYMQEIGLNAELITAPKILHTCEDSKVDTKRLKVELERLNLSKDTYYITQGFICSNYKNEIDNLGRGGSDYSAALMGVAINATEVQIWTDIDGMHNNDPRVVENTKPIPQMSFDEAAELAYFGAKILHPSTILPCKELGIPVKLKNTNEPKAEGTTISDVENESGNFHAVAAKDSITVIRICSARMLMAYGFLRKVFEVFEDHKTSIDMITTSEVAVSLTIDSDTHLDEIVEELSSLGNITIERDNTIVCVAGGFEYASSGRAAQVLAGISSVPVKMISYGANHRSMAILIDTKDKKETLQLLNNTLFN